MSTYRITKPYTAKNRPIIFNGEMIKAILDGRKTQTRRVIKDQSILSNCYALPELDGEVWYEFYNPKKKRSYHLRCPYGKIGDFLWVRETIIRRQLEKNQSLCGATYAADLTAVIGKGPLGSYCDRAILNWKWKRDTLPGIFMPRWASRISLRIVMIRVERVQDLSRDDMIAEGIPKFTRARGVLSDNPPDPRWRFIELWDSINAKKGYGWDSNPWVWVIEFEKTDKEDGQ